MSDEDKIISFIRLNGPVIPSQIAKFINSNILLASVHLSELSSLGKIKVSSLKIGGSPLYYLPEHRERLLNFAQNLNPKDQQTVNLLKEKKILRERNLDLFSRVSLRSIKDFAVPLTITLNNQKELFWKWHLLEDLEAFDLIKQQFFSQETPPPENKPEPTPIKENTFKEEPKTEIKVEPPIKEEPEKIPSEEKPPFQQKLIQELKPESLKPLETQEKLKRKPKEKTKKKEPSQSFLPQLEAFFQEKSIKIETRETIRTSEINFILTVPSVVGKLKYFCKAKNKKSCDEKDLSAAYMEAQARKLPLLFLYSSELTKKAQEILDSGVFENLIIKNYNK